MQRIELFEGATRICFMAGEASMTAPVSFSDAAGEYLRQDACTFASRPVYRSISGTKGGETKQTANGEVTVYEAADQEITRMSQSARLSFSFQGDQLLTGLGQHEDGVYDYQGHTEYLYQHNMIISIPFLLSSAGYGVLIEAGCAMRFESQGRSFHFDLDAVDGFSYVVLRGADCADVVRKLTRITGRATLLPKWAFGYIQSKERYESADELVSVAGEFRKRGLGLDCLVLDWKTWKDGQWGDKTPDPKRFPDVHALTDALHQSGVRLMVSIWPNMASGADHDAFESRGLFLPGSDIYDAFSPEAQDLYWRQCRASWMEGGIDAFWCDSTEPVTDPDWNGEAKRPEAERYRLITEAAMRCIDPAQLNAYASAHSGALAERWRGDYPEKRVAVLTRSGGAESSAQGMILWSGDISATWEEMRSQITEGIKIASCGVAYWTLDIGGFFVVNDAYERRGCGSSGFHKPLWFWQGGYNDGVDDPAYRELYVRWFQYGCMLPVFRAHGTDTPREPWRFGGENSLEYRTIKETIELRYRLMPYIYATAAQAHFEGDPMMRSLLLAFGEDARAAMQAQSYMLGDALLVAPVTRPLEQGGGSTEVYLPDGAAWYDFYTSAYYEGGQSIQMETPLSRFPLLVRAGSILPLSEGAECADALPLLASELRVYCGADGVFDLYDDAGDGYGYEQGRYLRIRARYQNDERILTLDAAQGSLPVDIELRVVFIQPDGRRKQEMARYAGQEMVIACAEQ